MDYNRLDELIKIHKKSDASNSLKEEYKSEIGIMLKEHGIDDVSMKYVYAGFSFCGVVPL